MVTELIRMLGQEKDQYALLLQLAEAKRAVLGQEDVAGLEKISQDEAVLLEKIKQLEKKRVSLAGAWASLLGLAKDASLSDLIAGTSPPYQEQLLLLQAGFNDLVQKIALINEANKKLIQVQLRYTNFFLNALAGPDGAANTYDNAGALREPRASRLKIMDRQV